MKQFFLSLKSLYLLIVRYTDELTLAGIGVFLYIAAGTTQTGWLYFIVSLIMCILALGYTLPRLNLRGIEMWREYPAFCYEGEEITITLHVRNSSKSRRFFIYPVERLSPDYFELRGGSITPVLSLSGGEESQTHYEVACLRRGIITLPRLQVQTAFPLGFFPGTKKIVSADRLVVYPVAPRPAHIPDAKVAMKITGTNQSYSLPGRSFDFLGVREYEPSDGIRFIHWPLTARLQKMMIKEFRDQSRSHIHVVLDTEEGSLAGSGKESTIEYEVKLAAGILNHCAIGKNTLSLIASKGEMIIESRNRNRYEALEFLAGLDNGGRLPTSKLLKGCLDRLSRGSTLYILQSNPSFDPEILKDLQAKRISVIIFYFQGFSFQDQPTPHFDRKSYENTLSLLRTGRDILVLEIMKGDDLFRKLEEARWE